MFSLKQIEQTETNRALAVREMRAIEGSLPASKKVRQVIDEETFVQGLEKIITRDYFPDLWKIQEYRKYQEESRQGLRMSDILSSKTAAEGDQQADFERDTDKMTLAQFVTKYTR